MDTAVDSDPSNAEQLRIWDGDVGAYWADNAVYFDRAVAGYRQRFLDAAAIECASRVLDIGCGSGQTTRDAARLATAGSALGVDLSSRMIEVARDLARREGVANAHFEQADAQVHPFAGGSFDAAISRTGAMFFGDPVAAFTNIGRALRPGGRLTLLTWQELSRNEGFREHFAAMAAGRELPAPPPGAPHPWSLADPELVRSILTAAGFADVTLEAVSEPMWFGADAADAQRFILGIVGWMLDGLDESRRERAIESLRTSVASHLADGGVWYGSTAWIIRAVRAGG